MLSRLLRAAGATLVALATLVAVPAFAGTVNNITLNTTLPQITPGTPYSHQLVPTGPSGYSGSYVFSHQGGTWPVGITVSNSGLVSGTSCDSNGSYKNITVRVSTVGGTVTTADFTDVNVNVTSGGGGGACSLTVSGSPPSGTAGTAYSTTITASGGGTGAFTFSLSGGSLPPGLTLSSTGVISGTPMAAGTYSFFVQASRSGRNGIGAFSITIAAAPPVTLNITPATLPNGQTVTGYSQMVATTNGTAPVSFAVIAGALPPGLALPSGGQLLGVPTVAGTYNFTVRATDALGNTGTRAYTVTIAGSNTLTLTPNTVPNATRSTPYTQFVNASNGTLPYTFSISAGALPAGMTLSPTGTLSGTPTAIGTFNFTARAVDANGNFGTRAYTMTVGPATLAIAPPTLPGATNGAVYTQTLTASGGTAGYSYALSSGTLPAGLTLGTTGTLSGTPSDTAGTFAFVVLATDAVGDTGSRGYTLTLAPASLTIDPATLPGARNGQAYGTNLTVIGGAAPATFSLVSGVLPNGVTLAADGTLSGTPAATAGTFNFAILATDANGDTITQAFSLVVAPAIMGMSPGVLAPATNGVAYSQAFTTTGTGTGPYTYAITAGALPNGMTLSAGGVLSGTPSVAAGTFNFSITVTDAHGDTATQAYALDVASAALAVNPATLPDGTNSTAYAATVTASGGVAPYAFSVSAGTLPMGLVLAGDGTISGTPTSAGSYAFTVLATDANGDFGARAYTVNIAAAAMTLTPASLPDAANGAAYSQALAASGGTAPYTYAVSSGTLPNGLALSATGTLSGTPNVAAGSYTFDITVTDANGDTSTQTFTLVVGAATITVDPATLPNGTNSSAYSATFTANGGRAPYSYTVIAGATPAGLVLAGDTLSGTPTTAGTYNFTIQATDPNGDSGSRAYSLTIAAATIAITPASLPDAANGSAYSETLGASGGTGPYAFAVSSGTLPNGLTLSSTGTLSGTPNVAAGTFSFDITVTDANGDTATQSFTLVVGAASITLNPATLPGGTNSSAYSATFAATGGTAPYTYAVSSGTLPTGLSLAGDTLSGTPTAAGTFNFTVQATDANGDTGARAYTVTIASATIAITPASLPGATNGAVYSQALNASGGTAPYSYAVSSGTLPSGITLSATGTLSGTPNAAAGTFSFDVTVTDANGDTATQSFTLVVGAASITLNPATLPTGTNSSAYSATFAATGGTAPYTYAVSSGTLPTGLSLAGDTLSGTPTAAGTFNFTVQATDANGDTGARAYTVTIASATIAITPASLPGATNGAAYSQALNASGGTAPYSYAVSSGTLPSGITLSSTGTLSGTPNVAAGTFSFDITVTDANGDTGTQSFTLVVGAASITVNPATLPGGTNSTAYSATFTGNGGTAPYGYAVISGTLPTGLSLAGDTLSGTPTAAGTFNFTVQATDANGDTGARAYTVTIASATIAITPASLPDATNGAAYSQALGASGGTAPYSYAVSSGTLPSGITLSATGTLSGTPNAAAGTFSFDVTVTDANGDTATQSFTLVVGAASITVNPATLPGGTNSSAYSATFAATGGTTPYSYAVISGTLPTGLSLAGDTLSGTPTAAGTFNFTVQATDANGDTGARAYTVTIASATIAITPASLPGATNGAAYSQALGASGGTAPYSYAVSSGTLPSGITLSATGTLSGTPNVAAGTFSFDVTVTDANGDTATRSFTLVVGAASIAIAPSTLVDATNGAAYSQVLTASGGTAPYTFNLQSGALPVGMSFSSTGTLAGTPNVAAGTFNLTIEVRDANGDTATQAYALVVNPATVTVNPASLPAGANSAPYTATFSATGGRAPYSYAVTASALPVSVFLAGDTISGTPSAAGTYTFDITATDANGDSGTRTYSVTIASATIAITPASLPGATNGAAYSQALAASGGTAPYTFAVTAGALPTGLALSAGGALSGTPNAAAGTFNFTVTATDANGDTASQAYSLVVGSATVDVTPASLPGGINGAAYSQTVSATGGTAPYTYAVTAGALPAGMTLSGTTVSGTPSCAAGTYGFTIEATDANGDIGTRAYSMVVSAAAIDVAPATLPGGKNGTAYAQSINASGGTGPYTYAIASGALPSGLTMSASGAISGTPAATGTFDLTVEATDANGDTGTHAYALVIAGGELLTVAPDAINGATAGDAYTQAFEATGGTGPYTFAVTAGALPEGLVLAADGTLSGTPTTQGTYDFTVEATDADGNFGSHVYALAVAEAIVLDIAPGTLAEGHAGSSYTQAFEATGGTGPYTFSISAGALPSGMTLSSDGTLSGTPANAGTYTFTVQGEDALGHLGQHAYTLAIGAPLRGDPTRDPGVIDLVNDQVAATRRMGELQLSHAFRRLAAPQAPCTVAAGESVDKCEHRVEAWATGTRETNFASGTAVTNAFTVGADMALGRVRIGAALGTGWDLVERASGYRGDADGITWMLYGRVALGETFGIAAVAGRTDVDLDSRRALGGGGAVVGQRDGENRFAGVEFSGQWNIGEGGVVPYVRYERSDLRLGTSAEGGNALLALQYGAVKTKQSAVVAGAEAFYGIRYDWGMLTPKVRVEYRQRRGDAFGQAMWYRDTPDTQYVLGVRGLDDSSALATFGLEAAFGGVKVTLEYGTAGSTDNWFDGQAVRLEFRADF